MKPKQKIHLLDAKDQILGRLSTQVAILLRGKNRPDFAAHILNQVKVVVYNTDGLKFSKKKLDQKKYYSHSGYPGGLKEKSLRWLFEKDSTKVFRKAVWGMLPKNRLRSKMIKNLEIYPDKLPKKYD